MTAQQFDPVGENRIRDDIKDMLRFPVLGGLPLREACRRSGMKYSKNSSQAKFTKAGRAFVVQLMRRRRVLQEFDVDEPCLATLIEIRDMALKSGSHIAATRAHELCLKVASNSNSDRKWAGGQKDPNEMTREEMIEELRELQLKAGGEVTENEDDEIEEVYKELMEKTKQTQKREE